MTFAAARRGVVALPLRAATTRVAMPSWAAPVAVGLVTLLIAMSVVRPYVIGAFHDDAIYAILARALATGEGYRYIHLPGAPSATHYPPGYPALLAILWRLAPQFPENVLLFERANACLLGASAVLAYVLAHHRMQMSARWAAAVAIIGTATVPPLALATIVLSESLFLAVLLAALVVAEGVVRPPAGGDGLGHTRSVEDRWQAAPAVAAGILCGAAALVRTVGIVVVVAAIGACLARRRPRAAFLLGAAATAVLLPWQLWIWRHTGELAPVLQGEYGSYTGWLTGAIDRHGLGFAFSTARHNVSDVVTLLEIQFAPRFPLAIKHIAMVSCAILVVAGLVRMLRLAPVTAAFAVLYAGEVVFWPFPPFRFVWAAWLFLVVALAMGTMAVWEWVPRARSEARLRGLRVARATALAGALLVGVGTLRYNVLGYRGHWWNTMQESLSVKMTVPLAWLATHPTLSGVMASDQEPAFYLYAGRIGVPCNSFTPDEYVYPRDTARDRAVLDVVLHRFPVGAVVATGPACALAAFRLTQGTSPALAAVDTMTAGFAVFARTTP